MREVWEIGEEGGGLMVAAVDCPVRIVYDGFETVTATHGGGFWREYAVGPGY